MSAPSISRLGRYSNLVARRLWHIASAVAILAFAANAQARQPDADSDGRLPLPPRTSRSADPPAARISSSIPKTLVVLGGVLAGVIVALGSLRRWAPGLAQNPNGGLLQILCQSPLGASAKIHVVRCGPRVLILASTATQVTALAEIADSDEIDQYIRPNAGVPTDRRDSALIKTTDQPRFETLKGQVDGLLDKVGSWRGRG